MQKSQGSQPISQDQMIKMLKESGDLKNFMVRHEKPDQFSHLS